MTTKEIIAAVIGAGGLGGLIGWWRFRKKDRAEAIKTIAEAGEIDSKSAVNITDAAYKLLDRVERQYKELEDRFTALELKFDLEQEKCLKEIAELKLEIAQLRK